MSMRCRLLALCSPTRPATLPPVSDSSPSLLTRLWLAWLCFFRTLFDAAFAARVARARRPLPPRQDPVTSPAEASVAQAQPPTTPSRDPALQLLSLLQREGRLIDFLQQDIAAFDDGAVGAAARVVHEGCRRALHAHASIVPIRTESEGSCLTLEESFDPASIKLTGNVGAAGPPRGTLRHRGWRAASFQLPTAVGTDDPAILAPAEIEL